jgi:hypothetical protein
LRKPFLVTERLILIPGMTKFSPTAHAMIQLLTGLDHPVESLVPVARAMESRCYSP